LIPAGRILELYQVSSRAERLFLLTFSGPHAAFSIWKGCLVVAIAGIAVAIAGIAIAIADIAAPAASVFQPL
jgi:hypothetical protein